MVFWRRCVFGKANIHKGPGDCYFFDHDNFDFLSIGFENIHGIVISMEDLIIFCIISSRMHHTL